MALTDKSEKEVVTYNYDTWGKLISIEGSLKDIVGIRILIDTEDIGMTLKMDYIIYNQDIITRYGGHLLMLMQ